MVQRLEAVYEHGMLRSLAPLDLDESQRVLVTVSSPNKPEPELKPYQTRYEEFEWLRLHGAEYAGQWLALQGGELVSHGMDGKAVIAEARAKGVDRPLMVRPPRGRPSAQRGSIATVRLNFTRRHVYPTTSAGVALPVALRNGDEYSDLTAIVDTGASHCLFERLHSDKLKLDLESGRPMVVGTATGRLRMFGHMGEIDVMGHCVSSMVYFFEDCEVNKNLLGRTGWLDRVRFGLVEYESVVFFAPYDFDAPLH